MKIHGFGLFAALVLTGLTAGAQDLQIAMQVRLNGQLTGSPRVMLQSGASAELSLSDTLKIDMTALCGQTSADIRLKLYMDHGDGLRLVGSPHFLAAYDHTSSLTWETDTGRSYELMLTPKRALPAPNVL